MNKAKTLYLLILGVIFLGSCNVDISTVSVTEKKIHQGWKFKAATSDRWSEATVPGCVHTDLLDNGNIKDPFYRLNEKDQQWIGETDWEYQTEFEVDPWMMQKENLELEFSGLDTYADVYLNDSLILSASNMFRTWNVPVKPFLNDGKNKLRVFFRNVFDVNQPKYDNAPYRLQAFANNDQADIKLNLYSRKAGFHYGWDWGPRLVTAGIWRDVTLKAWSGFKIDKVYYRQARVSEEEALIMAEFEISSSENLETNLSIECEGRILNQRAVKLTKGVNKVSVPIEIDNPKLWWTNGLGEQPLYTFNSTISDASGRFQMNSERIGIRSIEIVTDEDDKGKSFYVKLNGVPVFMKGANYIPQDNFQNRVTSDRYEHIIGSAAEANMNILRVWGGGIYEEDLFYDLCDEKGLLVWQDVMFACGMYPADDKYLENVAAEVTDNVERLRNHPSVALYCGNNENEISWYSWGWKDMYSNEIQKQYESDLKKLFYETIPDAIAKADPDRYYHPSSPIAGIGDDRPMEDGDTHYWGVWHGKEPFSEFENNVSRYISEYGFQSYPEFTSIKKFSIEEDWSLESDVMHAHQRCMSDERRDVDYGNRLINTYLERNFNTPKDFENYVYVVQALQAKGVKMAVETHRRNRTDEFCMGTMYWQINDCWPVASWSSIDYYGKWKALHYFAKKAYEQVLITHLEMEGNLGFYVVSDELNPLEDAVLSMRVLDFYGNEIWKENKQIDIKENTSAMYAQMSVEELLKGKDRSEVYVESQLEYSGEVIATNAYFFENEKQLKLPKVSIKHSMEKADSGYRLSLSSDAFAKYVMVSLDIDDAFLSDNYFDLVPGEDKSVFIRTSSDIDEVRKKIRVVSLIDSYNNGALVASK